MEEDIKQIDIAEELGDRLMDALASWNLGNLLAEFGDVTLAITLLQATVAFMREINHQGVEEYIQRLDEVRQYPQQQG